MNTKTSTSDAAEASTPVVSVDNLVRTYSGKNQPFTAVDYVSFHVNPGEVYGLLGTNGAGKTSTLDIVEGLAKASDGRVQVFGHDPYARRDLVRPHIGIMLQSGGLPTQLTVSNTINMWHGTCSHPRDPEEVLAEVELTHRRDVKVGSLSGGEQRRLDLACALLGDPSLLFLDEPTTGLDPESRRNVWDLLLGLKKRGVTMILTTHYLDEAEMLCDRLAIMHAGQFACEGTLSELVATVSARISFAVDAASPTRVDFPDLSDAHISTADDSSGTRYTIDTTRLSDDALTVLLWARDNNVRLRDFSARPATLEQLFLQIAGKQTASV